MTSLADRVFKDLKGVQPAADYPTQKIKSYVEKSMEREYSNFLEAKIAAESVEKARDLAKKRNYEIGNVSSKKPFFLNSCTHHSST